MSIRAQWCANEWCKANYNRSTTPMKYLLSDRHIWVYCRYRKWKHLSLPWRRRRMKLVPARCVVWGFLCGRHWGVRMKFDRMMAVCHIFFFCYCFVHLSRIVCRYWLLLFFSSVHRRTMDAIAGKLRLYRASLHSAYDRHVCVLLLLIRLPTNRRTVFIHFRTLSTIQTNRRFFRWVERRFTFAIRRNGRKKRWADFDPLRFDDFRHE